MKINKRIISRRRQRVPILTKKRLIIIATALIFAFLSITTAVLAWYLKDLPSPAKLNQNSEISSIFYDRNGKVLYELFKNKNIIPVKINDVSKYVIQATISIEDADFYKHQGISEKGLIRAFINTVFFGKKQGGSTITQQLIKNSLLTPERTISRKIKEFLLAFEVERRYTKDEILEMYLNSNPYGGVLYGIESAAKGYFGKSAKDLNLVESAILAGLPQRPSYYSPLIGEKDAWKTRTQAVLRRMREEGYITSDQEKQAIKDLDKVKFKQSSIDIQAPHFVFYVKELIEKEYGPEIFNQGLRIKTTLDLKLQEKTQEIVKNEIESLADYKVGNGAVVILNSETGEILTMVGSYDYNNEEYGNFNATLALRQPGSAVKPITYALAFENGFTPATTMMDVLTTFYIDGKDDYTPVNYDEKYRGPMQLRFALGNSINTIAVKLLALNGLEKFLQKAYDMGITTFEPNQNNLKRFGLSITLGGGEVRLLDLTSAYSVFARGGERIDPTAILEITTANGKEIYKKKEPNKKRVLSQEVSFLISHILSDNNARLLAFGPNSYLNVRGKTTAVKTGTTNDKRDNWTIGFTKNITVGVWVGNNDNSQMNQRIASGITGASPIWNKIMTYALNNGYQDGIAEKPDNVTAVEIDAYLGGLPHPDHPKRVEYFIKGTEPKTISPFYKKLKISKTTGKLANEDEIRTGNYEEKDYIVITEQDPLSKDGKNRWQEAIDKWIEENGDESLKAPKEISDYKLEGTTLIIKEPKDKQKLSNTFEIKGSVLTNDKLEKIEFYVNSEKVDEINNPQNSFSKALNLSDGSYSLTIKAITNKETKEATLRIGINQDWQEQKPTATPSPTQTTTETPTPTDEPTTTTPTPTPTP
ncbi:MAG: hypothetical protein KatS3mg090_0508 [Patescibacteria group bacterium]|nr:MAG: hypothetical protein KatS3mg090_0508 [Patescibacteria group bacterium]